MKDIFLNYLEVSVTTGMIICLLLLLTAFLNKRYTAKWKYWIWLLLAVRLLIPVNLSVVDAPVIINFITEEQRIQDAVVIDTTSKNVSEEQLLPLYWKPIQVSPIQHEINSNIFPWKQSVSVLEIFYILWFAGIVVFLFYHGIRNYLYRRNVLLGARECENKKWSELPGKAEIPIPFLVSSNVQSPMIIGLFMPILVLPEKEYTAQELQFILQHEMIHYHRKDLWYKLLLLLANAVHWFNPLVYLMFREAGVDLEYACDAEVVKEKDFDERKLYVVSILNHISDAKMSARNLSTYFYGGKKNMKNRFENILYGDGKKKGKLAFLLMMCVVLCAGSLMACSIKDNPENLPDGYVLIEEMNCAVKLPESWDGKYVILYEAFDDTLDGAAFTQVASYEDGYYHGYGEVGTVFFLIREKGNITQEELYNGPVSSILLMQEGGYTYYYSEPSDVQVPEVFLENPTEKEQAIAQEYLRMYQDIEEICESIIYVEK